MKTEIKQIDRIALRMFEPAKYIELFALRAYHTYVISPVVSTRGAGPLRRPLLFCGG